MTHELKIRPEYFQAVWNRDKKAELRKDDRDFRVGDELILREYDNGYTGSFIIARVTHILRDCPEYGLEKGFCILSIEI